jgi:dipeptidase E
MKLLLTSAGISNASMANALRQLVGEPTTEKRFVYIPTALNPERGSKPWVLRDMNAAFDIGWGHFDIIDIAALYSLGEDAWLPGLEAADVIMVGGGNCFYLSYWMQKTGLMEKLPALLKDKVYVGNSAGSMIMSPEYRSTFDGEIYHDAEYGEQSQKGEGSNKMANIVPFCVRPHLNSPKFPNITLKKLAEVAKEVRAPMYALDDQSAVQVVDGAVTVVSEGQWHLYNDGK